MNSSRQLTGEADPARIAELMTTLADFGRYGPTGVDRVAFTPEDEAAHTFIGQCMADMGLEVHQDAFGNVFGRREGADGSAAVVLTGSHLDGPPAGGMYDGTAGVACALEAIRVLSDSGVATTRPIEVVAIRCEHLDRFGLSCLGSRALAGELQEADLDQLVDGLCSPTQGHTLRRVLSDAGHLKDSLATVRLGDRVDSFLELHIEQGRVLETRHERLGIVTGIAGPTRFNVTLEGVADHSGGTPMDMRKDALCGAAEMILALESLAAAEPPSVGTIGVLAVRPGALHTIPGEAVFGVDIRGVAAAAKQRVVDEFTSSMDTIAQRRGLKIERQCTVDEPPVLCSERVIATVRDALADGGLPAIEMLSGGGHDAQHLAKCVDAGMLFVPSVAGISHAPSEYTSWEDLANGATALAHCLVRLADA